MCIYRIKSEKRWICGKRIPLECTKEICPFGPEKYELLVRMREKDTKYFWVCKKSGEMERIDDAEEAIRKVKNGEGECVAKGTCYKISKVKKVGKKKGEMFDEALKLTRLIDVNLEGEQGMGAKIAIVDSGVSPSAPAVEKITLHETSVVDQENHGGAIHEIIYTILPKANFYIIQVLGEEIPDYLLINALSECEKREIHAINLSIQSETPSDGDDPLSRYVNYLAEKRKIATVIAAGNGGPKTMTIGSPGAALHAITVGACDIRGALLKYSSRGPTLDGRFKPDLIAPSNFIFSYYYLTGTSFATPFVTAAASILNRDLKSAIATRRILHLSARPCPVIFDPAKKIIFKQEKMIFNINLSNFVDFRNHVGAGVLDAKNAINIKNELVEEIKT